MKILKKINKRGPKHGNLLGISIDSTNRAELLKSITSKLDVSEKFYILTPNPEIILKATKDWLLKKTIKRATFSVPDGIGIKYAFKFLHNEDVEIIKGRELFLDILEIADKRNLRVYLFGGEFGESEKAKIVLEKTYKNIIFKTNHQFPEYNKNCKPINLLNRKLHKSVIGSVKMFEPDLIFVAMKTPKQEKWIYRNFFRLSATGAMAVGGTFNYIAGSMKLPLEWMTKLGVEWLYRLIQEPRRIGRIINAVIIFPWKIFLAKLLKQHFES